MLDNPAGRVIPVGETGWYRLPSWHCDVTLQNELLAFSICDDRVDSQLGMSADIESPSSAFMLICMGHSPVKPLAASPLMGSAAHSNRRSKVRRNFMTEIIAAVL